VLRPGESPATVPPEALFAHWAARLAPFKVPRYLEYREELPRTPTLRVQRHLLTQVRSGENGSVFDRLALKGESVP
jgi:crotonobetaine/carnitine-CoA ligase